MSKTIIHTNLAPAAVGPYSQVQSLRCSAQTSESERSMPSSVIRRIIAVDCGPDF